MLEYASAFNKQTNLFPAVSAQSHPIHLLESGTNLWLCSPCFCDLWCPYCTCMNALRALGSLWSLYVCCIGCWSARFAPFKLLRMRKKVGISPMRFEQCISVTSDTSKWPQKISWELSPVITWQCRERYLCLRGFSPGVPHWSDGLTWGLHLPQWQVKSPSRNCLKHNFW